MLSREFLEMLLEERSEAPKNLLPEVDEANIYETASLISGSIVYPLCWGLWLQQISTPDITAHLETLYDSGNFQSMTR